MAPKSNKSFAKATTKLGLATAIAALWLTAVPITGAVADVQTSAARAAALQQCNRLAARYPLHDYRSTALKLKLRRALQVSAEGLTEGHIAAQPTEPQWLDRVGTAITAIAQRPTAGGCLTAPATPHLVASTPAATP